MTNVMTSSTSTKIIHKSIIVSLCILSFTGGIFWFMNPPIVTEGDSFDNKKPAPYTYASKRVIVHLDQMTITLIDGTSTPITYPILSKGKPGSYYETMGGSYINDYKTPLHFSSIGHVYMPYSVHVFGNYFIHGVPYYPDGTEVSSAYSGGCIRLTDEYAKIVYTFIDKGTQIIITKDSEASFVPTAPVSSSTSSTLTSQTMTNLMVASISLEALTQDNQIIGLEGEMTTRKTILPRLVLDGNTDVAELYADSIGQDNFVRLMNQKAKALGLSNTHFSDVTSPVMTTYEDQMRFMKYIGVYKSYLEITGSNPDDRPLR